MTFVEQSPIHAAHRLMPRLWVFVWIGLGLLIPGLLIPQPMVSLGFTVSSTTFFAFALIIMGLNRKHLASSTHFHESLDVFIHNDNAPTFFVKDDGEISYVNHAARKRFGAVENNSLVMVLSEYAANPVNVIFRLQNKARKSRSSTQDIVTNTGHLRLSAHYIGPNGFIWRLEDLIERRDTQKAEVTETLMPMLLSTAEGKVLYANRALFALTGRRITHIDRLFQTLPIDVESPVEIAGKDGLILVKAVQYIRENGQIEIYFHAQDVAVLPKAEPIIDFDELPVALMKLSASGIVLRSNRLARNLLEQPATSEVNISDLVMGLGRPVSDWLVDVIANRTLNKPEVVQINDKSIDKFLQIALRPVIENGETHLIAVLNDATELKTLEAQFVQSQKMQAIGQLAGGVAHDFNNLLTAISGYCDLLLMRHDEGDPDYGDLIQITQNANRAASLVSQLLAFSRKQNLQPEILEMPDLLSDLTHLLNRLLGEKVTLNVKHCQDVPKVRADKRQLEQVLMNLVVNARDAMPMGGEVMLESDALTLHKKTRRGRAMVPAGEYLSLKVHDNGTGIASSQLTKIFEPFYTTKPTGEGTGLGLSMVYGIIKQSGGYIFVESQVGQGTVFEILLPVYDADAQPEEQVTPMPSFDKVDAVTPLKDEGVILLVEDEAPVRAFAARALEMRGYTVLEAADADEALKLLEDGDLVVDLFVTDVVMPGKDGPTWVREALQARPGVKVVFVSGYAEETIAKQQADIKNSVFLPKPFSLVELTEKVRSQLAA